MNKVEISPAGLIEELPGYETQDYNASENVQCHRCVFDPLLDCCATVACTHHTRSDGRSVIFVYKG